MSKFKQLPFQMETSVHYLSSQGKNNTFFAFYPNHSNFILDLNIPVLEKYHGSEGTVDIRIIFKYS